MPGVVPFGLMQVDWEERINFERMRKERLEKARASMRESDVDCLFLVRWENARYTTSARGHMWPMMFFGHVVVILPRDDDPYLFYGDIEFPKAKAPWIKRDHIKKTCWLAYDSGAKNFADEAKKIMSPNFKGRIGVDAWNPPLFKVLPKEFPGVEWVDGQEVMLNARYVKTEDELNCMKIAYAIAEAGMQDATDFLRPGVRECEVIGVAFKRFWDFGAEWTQCGTVVNSGPYGAPYRRYSGDRIIQDGDIVNIDIGPCWNGYFADVTRTWICGRSKPTEEQKKLAREAYMDLQGAIKELRPGITKDELLEKAGPHFGGHGIGIAGFEKPYVLDGRAYVYYKPAEPGEIGRDIVDAKKFEPGVTIVMGAHAEKLGVGGVKMEEHCVVTKTGCEVYSTFPRGPFVDAAMEGYE